MADDLSDLYAELRKLQSDVHRLQANTMLENAAVGRGGVRFHDGGGIKIDDGGYLRITGGGLLYVDGEWFLIGNGKIDGDVDMAGDLTATGRATLIGPVDVKGILSVLAGGKIKVGTGVTLEPGAGAGKVTVSGASGDMVIQNSRIEFPAGAKLQQNAQNFVGLFSDTSGSITVGDGRAEIGAGIYSMTITDDGHFFESLPPHSGEGLDWVGVNSSGKVHRVAGSA
ncbi:hypothetical protein [Microbacterium gorillae]|uniref:hypothetical protein n=1 Tax=Microbacterium gorillae TaxID=1231063 RepID=UPI0005905E55|nr:hypothetical protein [Microbacterium gorillae]